MHLIKGGVLGAIATSCWGAVISTLLLVLSSMLRDVPVDGAAVLLVAGMGGCLGLVPGVISGLLLAVATSNWTNEPAGSSP